MVARKKVSDAPIYQLKVTLRDSKPPIWRRLQVRGDTRLDRLHLIIQIAMGWTDSHLHQFIVGGVYYGEPDPEWDMDVEDEGKIQLNQVASGEKVKFFYEYDFGDGWQHEVLVEKILEPEPETRYPSCIKGKRNCPPEDVGGVWGYEELLEAIQDEDHPEHGEYLEWIDGPFDPEAFDLEEVNQALRKWL